MVHIASFLATAVILSSLNWVTALPQPGSDMTKRDSYSSSGNPPPNTGSNSDYGSSNSGYGSSSSGYNSGYNSSSGNQQDGYGVTVTTTTSMNDMSTMVSYSTMTTETAASTASVMYGSGSMNSGLDSYNDCVAQCMASYPPLPTATSTYGSSQTYASGSTSGESSSVGTGATKTIIVAPTQGMLRFVPFAMNASIGDTIEFVWGANNHTVTKGSALLPCNATQDALFTTNQENKGFTFTQVINSTDTIFFHCATPGHCPKGMFGVINPPSNLNAPTSVSGMMQSLIAQNPSLSSYAAAADNETSGSRAAFWGGNIDMASVPEWAQPFLVENVLFTRRLLAANPEIFGEDGSINLSSAQTTPLMYPPGVQADLVQNTGVSATPSQASPTVAAGAASTNGPVTSPTTNGASSAGPNVLALLVAGLATVLIL